MSNLALEAGTPVGAAAAPKADPRQNANPTSNAGPVKAEASGATGVSSLDREPQADQPRAEETKQKEIVPENPVASKTFKVGTHVLAGAIGAAALMQIAPNLPGLWVLIACIVGGVVGAMGYLASCKQQ